MFAQFLVIALPLHRSEAVVRPLLARLAISISFRESPTETVVMAEPNGLDEAGRTGPALAGIELEQGIGKGFLVPGDDAPEGRTLAKLFQHREVQTGRKRVA